MTAFAQVPLAEICTIVGGGTPRRTNKAYFDGPIPWATPTDVTALDSLFINKTKETITEIGLRESSARLVPAGTVLMTSRATIGYTAIAIRPMATNQGFANLICGERVAPEYLAYWLHNQRHRLIQLAGGTTFRELPKSTLKKVRIPLPSLDEQRRTVGILNRAAKIERLQAQAADRLREFIPALFVRMFGDPVENPHGHRQQILSECANLISGATPSKKNKAFWNGEIPWVSAKDMKVDLISDSEDHVSDLAFVETALKTVPANTTIIVVRGMILAHTVPIALAARPVAINQDMKAVCFDSDIDPVFGFWCLKVLQKRILDYVDTAAHGTKRIEMSRLGAIPMLIPSSDLQRRFVQLTQRVRSIVALAGSGSNTVSRLTDSLKNLLLDAVA